MANSTKPVAIISRGSTRSDRRPEIGAVTNIAMPVTNIVLPIISEE